MNTFWGLFFKDKFKTPFSLYRMSLAEIVFLLAGIGALGYYGAQGAQWLFNLEFSDTSVLEE